LTLLFVVVLEALSRMLSAMVNKGLLLGFSMGSMSNDELSLFHLLFADDTLIFCEANLEHLHIMCCLFLCFEVVFGLKVNLAKSELVLVRSVENVEGLACVLGCRVSSLPMKYLSLSLEMVLLRK
jgi:hypothetical protein